MKIERQKYSMTEVNNWNNYIKKGHSVTEAAKYFGVPYKSLLNLLNRHGLRIPTRHTPPHRKNPNNITYFDEINSHKKAYFLGLLFSDGYICSGNYTSGKQMGIALQLQDKYILEELHKELNLNTKLSVYKNSVKLVVTDVHLYNSLQKLGIKEDKSHKDYILPPIKKKFLRSFLLGYFDGDGCITNIYKTPKVEICCNSKIFLESVRKYLEYCQISSKIHIIKKPKNPLYNLTISGKESRKRFTSLIYKKSPIYLLRKHEKFIISKLLLPSL